MGILVIEDSISLAELRAIAEGQFGDFVKFVVDIDKEITAIGGELHADEEAVLLERGSAQQYLWGINYYPDSPAGERIEYDSMINVRPRQGNRSKTVEDGATRQRISAIVSRMVSD